MKKYLVFMKQVPMSTKVDIDPVTKTLRRATSMSRTNPDDLCALQAALNLKETNGAEITAISMGPLSAEEVLREALQLGADHAILISSPAFAGCDTLCTSRVLAAAARKAGYDMLFFGRMAIDGDTAQVGPEVAGLLDIPQVTRVISIDAADADSVTVTSETGETVQTLRVATPCAVMASKEFAVCPPTLNGWRWAQRQTIVRWDENDLGLSCSEIGLNASPTKVVLTEVISNRKHTRWITDAAALAQAIKKCM